MHFLARFLTMVARFWQGKKKSTHSSAFPNAGGPWSAWIFMCGYRWSGVPIRFHVYDGMLPTLFLLFVDGAYEFVALSVDVDDFHIGVVL